MSYQVISADTHLDLRWLPSDLFVSNAPQGLKQRMPRVQDTEKGVRWIVDEQDFCSAGGGGFGVGDREEYVPGESRHLDRMAQVGFYDGVSRGVYHPVDPSLRIKDQDIDSVDAEVIYGVLGVGGGMYGASAPKARVQTAIYDIYNEFAADLVKAYPRRLAALACLTGHDPEVSARQLRRAAELGLRGAEINVSQMSRPIYHDDWNILWATAAECSMPISFHTLGLSWRQPDPQEQEKYRWVNLGLLFVLFQLSGAEFLTAILLSGACEKNPDFKFVLGECGVGWLPYVLERTDLEYEDRLFHLGLKLKPTDYWRRQGYSTFQQEYMSMDEIQRIGVDNIMWGSDYPHPDGVFPDSRKAIQEGMGHLPEEIKHKIVCETAARLYRFDH